MSLFLRCGALLLTLGLAAPVSAEPALALRLGSTGVGAELLWPVADRLDLRAYAGGLSWDRGEQTLAGVGYARSDRLLGAGILADWHPWGGSLRLSAGLVLNGNEATLDSRCQPSCVVGGSVLVPAVSADARINGSLDYGQGASYGSLGWVWAPPASRWFASLELGLLMQYKPASSLTASGSFVDQASGQSLSEAERDARVAAEQAELDASLASEDVYPVLSFSLGWRL